MRHALTIWLALVLCLSFTSSFMQAAEDAPAKKLQVLLITGDDVGSHKWKETAPVTKDILVASGKFDVNVVEGLAVLDAKDDLAKYDVIFFHMYNSKKAPISDAGKENLLNFVKDGKGFVVAHLASASFPKWDEFNKLCGRYWLMGKSGHGKHDVFEAVIADKDHPITKGLSNFKQDDELYAKLLGEEKIHVLVQADSDWSKKTEPLVFIQEVGKGRVFHTAFGHDVKALATPEVKTLTVRGTEWAATGKVTADKAAQKTEK